MKESLVLLEAGKIENRLLWLREHPGKTRRDYNAGRKNFPDSEVWQWSRAKYAERAAFIKDGGAPEVYDQAETWCGGSDAGREALEKWRATAAP